MVVKNRNLFKLFIFLTLILNTVASQNLFCQEFGSNYFAEDQQVQIPYTLIIGSFFFDKTLQKLAQENQTKTLSKFADIDRYYGDKYVTGGALLGLYGMSYLLKNEKLKETSEKAILAAAVSGILISGLKEIFGRSRPYRKDGTLHFKPFSFKESRRSLPSGHAGVTFAISTIMANSMDNTYWKTFWYTSAISVGAARIYKNNHWFSDVVTGSVLGYFVAQKTEELFRENKSNPIFGLTVNNGVTSLSFTYPF
ncbi:MAG: phosphatase PAP2 family protein [Calditrichae bacterium]|nr:phosphatase PAP2 family protein [Calditrichota bacterium]MCB9058341.1 phosphatase PAP2 family protein [Calditrichia bacterium]